MAIVNFRYLLDFAKIFFSIWLYLIVYFQKSFPKMSTNHTIKDVYLTSIVSHMWNFGDIVCWGYVMLEMWDVPDVGCSECEKLEMWDVGDV